MAALDRRGSLVRIHGNPGPRGSLHARTRTHNCTHFKCCYDIKITALAKKKGKKKKKKKKPEPFSV